MTTSIKISCIISQTMASPTVKCFTPCIPACHFRDPTMPTPSAIEAISIAGNRWIPRMNLKPRFACITASHSAAGRKIKKNILII